MKKVLVPIAHGTVEIEAINVVEILRRANFKVKFTKVYQADDKTKDLSVKMQYGLKMLADNSVRDVPLDLDLDAIIMPGGMKGAETFFACPQLKSLLRRHASK